MYANEDQISKHCHSHDFLCLNLMNTELHVVSLRTQIIQSVLEFQCFIFRP